MCNTTTTERTYVIGKDGRPDLSAQPPVTLAELRAAIPAHLWKKSVWRSLSYVLLDVCVVAALAVGAQWMNAWYVWPLYWVAQGTMFWALFVLGHDCGHGSFSDNATLNYAVGHALHSFILVPFHGWRLSHKKHHGNHGHVENDESWHPLTKDQYDASSNWVKLGRLSLPFALLSYPLYLIWGTPGRHHSHYDPASDLFSPAQRSMVITSNACMVAQLVLLSFGTWQLGFIMMAKLYWVPYWIGVMWLTTVTYLHHHGSHDPQEKMPWYRGEEWSYLRGGLTTIDRDYGVFNKIHHDIGTHVVHHLFPQIPHYNLIEATEAIKPLLGPYYRPPARSPGPLPYHLLDPLVRSFASDLWVPKEGDIVFYQGPPKKVE